MKSSSSLSILLLLAAANVAAGISRSPFGLAVPSFIPRGGESVTNEKTKEETLDEKVQSAMKKLGISAGDEDEMACKDGVCTIPNANVNTESASAVDPNQLAREVAEEMNVDPSLAMAAIGATSTFGTNNQRLYNGKAAREMIQQELDLIANIPEESEEAQQLISEGFDPFMSRRALAFAEKNMDDARAILLADKFDQEEEEAEEQKSKEAEDDEAAIRAQLRDEKKNNDVVEVKANFDPTTLPLNSTAAPAKPQAPEGMPKPAAKESVVFEATTAQLQELVLESPVPVLLDVYADWCGPCKALTPALSEMAVKSGGAFRLVKLNSDNEKPASAALEVKALPTVFGIRDGKIIHMFEGMPKSEEMMKNFMMGLFNAAPFQPAVTDKQTLKYEELTAKLIKTASSASFPFSARERLTERINTRLNELVESDSISDVEGAARLMRTLFNNIVLHPLDKKYRSVNLENKAVASKIGSSTICLSILKSVGFGKSGSGLIIGKDKKIVNLAPLMIARDAIDHWIQKNEREMVAAARRQKDLIDREKVQAELAAAAEQQEAEEEEEEEEVDSTICKLKVRLDGKKKVHEMDLSEDDPISKVADLLEIDQSQEFQITCVAKRLVLKSTDKAAMQKSLKEHKLMPAAAVVVKVGEGSTTDVSSLKERATKKALKKGSHSMHSIGIYAKDDNNKAELIDGGGGVWYEHDISDDEDEAAESAEDETGENAEKVDDGIEEKDE
ncbi:unnamed protein product [Cylindrotheca closterium]|uniref:Thioredoxin domain-containing protein n=1 Tax=Cylindrotheca closterium TaxID=2856 RepID=A0AAD2FLU3_9STRA|nr:unnamed protein product [Cylindrotheca closterium]